MFFVINPDNSINSYDYSLESRLIVNDKSYFVLDTRDFSVEKLSGLELEKAFLMLSKNYDFPNLIYELDSCGKHKSLAIYSDSNLNFDFNILHESIWSDDNNIVIEYCGLGKFNFTDLFVDKRHFTVHFKSCQIPDAVNVDINGFTFATIDLSFPLNKFYYTIAYAFYFNDFFMIRYRLHSLDERFFRVITIVFNKIDGSLCDIQTEDCCRIVFKSSNLRNKNNSYTKAILMNLFDKLEY